ncbi:MAG: hypothetical protein AAF752_12935 [Bacteroidota bacterium]
MRVLGLLILFVSVSGCANSLTPLYRDFEVRPVETSMAEGDAAEPSAIERPELEARVERALGAAGWAITEGPADNVVSTESRQMQNYGIYSIRISLDVLPMAGNHVRVLVHPYRHYFTGSRSKLPYLKRGLGRSFLPELERAFADEGIVLRGTQVERDEDVD